VSCQDNIYSPSTAEINYQLTKQEVGETGGVTTTAGEVKGNLRHQGKLFWAIEMLFHCIARPGLDLAGSTGVPAATGLGEFAISIPDQFLDFVDFHNACLPWFFANRVFFYPIFAPSGGCHKIFLTPLTDSVFALIWFSHATAI
jgi:hypothetical protein